MPLTGFDQLYELADARKTPAIVAVVAADDPTVLEAVSTAAARGWITPLLFGSADRIRETATRADVELSAFEIVNSETPATAAVSAVREGRAQLLMKGQIDTPTLLRAMLKAESGLTTGRTICQIVLMEVLDQARPFLLADTGITIQPTLEQKAEILASAIAVAHSLGCNVPRVALMSATEKVTPSMPDTLESAELVRRAEAGEFPHSQVQGPLSFDLAWAADAGEKKRIGGDVCGGADVLLFPNLLAANLTVKAIMYTARCRFGGVLAGAACPVVFMSRADTTSTRLNSLALALRMLGK